MKKKSGRILAEFSFLKDINLPEIGRKFFSRNERSMFYPQVIKAFYGERVIVSSDMWVNLLTPRETHSCNYNNTGLNSYRILCGLASGARSSQHVVRTNLSVIDRRIIQRKGTCNVNMYY